MPPWWLKIATIVQYIHRFLSLLNQQVAEKRGVFKSYLNWLKFIVYAKILKIIISLNP